MPSLTDLWKTLFCAAMIRLVGVDLLLPLRVVKELPKLSYNEKLKKKNKISLTEKNNPPLKSKVLSREPPKLSYICFKSWREALKKKKKMLYFIIIKFRAFLPALTKKITFSKRTRGLPPPNPLC